MSSINNIVLPGQHLARTPSEGNGISRRQVLRGATAIGTVAAMAPLLAGCGSDESGSSGTLRIGMGHGETTDSYDPASWDHAFVQVFAHARHGYLTEVAPDGALIGELAEEWEAEPGASVWLFKLRQGVTYHSGKTVTPEDVIASIEYHRGEDSTSAAKPLVAPIKRISRAGSDTVRIELEAGNADFPFVLSDYHLPILPSSGGRINPKSSDGAGAYIVERFDPGVVATMRKYPDYWKPNAGKFERVEILVIQDPTARQNALLSGEVDVIDKVDSSTVDLLNARPGINVLSTTGTQHFTFAMDTRKAPFRDNNVRQALKFAIDREELVAKVLNGYGTVGNDHPIGPSNRYFASNLEQKTYDPDRAKFFLRKAGLSNVSVQLSAADAAFSGAVDAAVLFSEKARVAGVNVEVVREPNDGYWSNVWMQKPFSAVYWGGRATEDWMFSTAYASGVAWNDTFWDHDRFNVLLKQARSELNDAIRREMYTEMQDIVSNEGGAIIPMFASYIMAYSDKVKVPNVVAANWSLDGLRAPERWSF